jgi:hypothetical protein
VFDAPGVGAIARIGDEIRRRTTRSFAIARRADASTTPCIAVSKVSSRSAIEAWRCRSARTSPVAKCRLA